MKSNWFSRWCLLVSAMVILATRLYYSPVCQQKDFKLSTWDALGYYIYLPSHFIYGDDHTLQWKDSIDSTYQLSGGTFYQASQQANRRYVFKYMKGVSHLQWPFFMAAHYLSKGSPYPADGFSLYYQIAIALAALVYAILGLILLRRFLLYYFSDQTTGLTILLIVLASNALQYFSVDGGMSHVYIFPLYAAMLLLSRNWHIKPGFANSIGIGLVFGTAIICRPTEAVMLFIPLLWNVNSLHDMRVKIRDTKSLFIVIIFLSVFVAIIPQLLYWKESSGRWWFDVGSKWDFLSPHWRVLLGWEKGWFIYTPIAIFMMLGLFFLNSYPFQRSVIVFTLLNIYIIIAWHIWRYGASYSCRALVESYPVMAIPLAASIQSVLIKQRTYLIYPIAIYLCAVNLFQIKQYNDGILHYDHMNRSYYQAIYLNPDPGPLQMSLLDYPEQAKQPATLKNTKPYKYNNRTHLMNGDTLLRTNSTSPLVKLHFELRWKGDAWLSSYAVIHNNTIRTFRLENPLARTGEWNTYEAIIPVKEGEPLDVVLNGPATFTCDAKNVFVTNLSED